MPSTRENVFAALLARLQPLAALTLRDEVLPERIPAAGLIILRDGQPGEPEVTLSPLRYHYQNRAELEVVVKVGTGRATAFDALIVSIGAALEADRTLAGLCDWVELEAPASVDLPVEGVLSEELGLPRSRSVSMPRGMTKRSPFRYFKTSPEIIRLAVMLYIRFPLSLRNVEDLLHERGIEISHETVRYWWNRFGPMLAAEIRGRRVEAMRAHRHWRWHLDEVYVKINGVTHYLWRAVDHEGEVLESIVTKTRDRKAALKFLKKSMRRHGRPETIVTDRLRSYGAALKDLGRGDDREMGRWLNNRAENSHLPFRRRERAMLRFRRMRTLQKFASVHASVHNHFPTERHLQNRNTYKQTRAAALAEWRGLLAA